MVDAFEVIAIDTGEPANSDPASLTPQQAADILEMVAATDVDVAVQRLDELLAQLRPATRLRRPLTRVPVPTLRAAVELLARRQGQR